MTKKIGFLLWLQQRAVERQNERERHRKNWNNHEWNCTCISCSDMGRQVADELSKRRKLHERKT